MLRKKGKTLPTERHKLKIFLTIDTEVWEFYDDIEKNIGSGLWGLTSDGEYGLNFQLETFTKFDLKATFFIEPFFTYHSGETPLKSAIENINAARQEIGVHIHTEWLQDAALASFDLTRIYRNIGDFEYMEQVVLIKHAKDLISRHTGNYICSFRAGNYGADDRTLKALSDLDITFDTSYNKPYLTNPCNINSEHTLSSPELIRDTVEVPVTHFNDYASHIRHLQLSACSFEEIKDVLVSNWKAKQYGCVLVMHSFEWIKRNRKNNSHSLDKICLKRFLKLCQYLADNNDKFETYHFKDINIEQATSISNPGYIAKSKPISTIKRFAEQYLRRP